MARHLPSRLAVSPDAAMQAGGSVGCNTIVPFWALIGIILKKILISLCLGAQRLTRSRCIDEHHGPFAPTIGLFRGVIKVPRCNMWQNQVCSTACRIMILWRIGRIPQI